MSVSSSLDIPIPPRPGSERRVYTWGAIAALLVVFAGFAPSYYLKGVFGTPELSTLKHLHGVVMTSWFVLFITQVRLVATGRTALHRQLGLLGIVVAVALVSTGTTLGIASARSGVTPIPGVSSLVFLVLPIGEVVAFTCLFATAIAMRKRPAFHKRLMLLATLAMLVPAVARLPFDFVQAGAPLSFFAVADVLIVACIAFDTLKNRRLHPAFLVGFIFLVVTQIGRLAISQTAAWMQFAKWLVA
jgi:hypothetical protein